MATQIEGKSIENAIFGLSKAPKSGHYLIMHGFSKTLERLMNPIWNFFGLQPEIGTTTD